MKKSRFTEEQIAYALKQVELGMAVGEVCRKMGIAEATFHLWRKKYGLGSLHNRGQRFLCHGEIRARVQHRQVLATGVVIRNKCNDPVISSSGVILEKEHR